MDAPAGPCVMLVSTTYRGKRPRRPVSRVCLGCYAPEEREHVKRRAAELQVVHPERGYTVEDSPIIYRAGTPLPLHTENRP